MNWWLMYLLVLLGACGLTALLVPPVRTLARRLAFLDKPLGEAHKRHAKATPLLGGAAMFVAWLGVVFGGLAAALWLRQWLPPAIQAGLGGLVDPGVGQELAVITGGGLAMCFLGTADDRTAMGPLRKLLLQIAVCALVACYPKLQVTLFWEQPGMRWVVTVAWYVFVVNAFNFFDNMDGLAAGIAVIAAGLFAVVAGFREQYFVAALAACTAGVALGFYLYNCNPASIFMGDGGSHFLGFMLATLASLTKFYLEDATPTVTAVFIPIFIMALPIFDTFAVVLIRLHQHLPIYKGDHNHISHRFLKMGVSRKVAVLLVHLLALAIGLGALPLLWLPPPGALLVLLQAATMLALVTLLHVAMGIVARKDPGEAAKH